MTKIIALLLSGILFLSNQSPSETMKLSNTTLVALHSAGIETSSKQLRHDIHYVEYGILGLALGAEYGADGVPIGVAVAFIDEASKESRPPRKFDLDDLQRDFVGVIVGVCLSTPIWTQAGDKPVWLKTE